MRNCGAEFVRGVLRHHVGVDIRGAVRVCVLDWDGEVPVLSGRWDDDLGKIVDWSAELLAPEGMATEALAGFASAALRREHDWTAPPVTGVPVIAAEEATEPAAVVEPISPTPSHVKPAPLAPRPPRSEPVQLALSVVVFGAATVANSDETGPRARVRGTHADGASSGRRRPRRPGQSTRVG